MAHTRAIRLRYAYAGLVLVAVLSWIRAPLVLAQPFETHDAFYQNETARRAFFDDYALAAQVSYPGSGILQNERVIDPDLVGFSFRADYQVVPQVDVGAIVDARGTSGGRSLLLSWLVLKYYRHVEHEHADYALRLAIDPRPNGRVGFPQVDAAFIYTSLLSPFMTSDFAIGLRRVQMGYREVVSTESEIEPLDIIYRRAMGWELHAMTSYNLLLGPAGSNLFVALSGDLSRYDIIELNLSDTPASVQAQVLPTLGKSSGDEEVKQAEGANALAELQAVERAYQGGVVWLRAGLTYSRPAYQVRPYFALPLRQWRPEAFERPRGEALLHAGVRFMLR